MKILSKKSSNPSLKAKKLSINDIKNFYEAPKDFFKIGIEYERLSLDRNTLKTAKYENVAKTIEHFASINSWTLIYDSETLIGAKDKNNNSISLEPACQLEISLAPSPYLLEIKKNLTSIVSSLDNISKIYDVIFVGYGINPTEYVDDIQLIDKKRYKIMDKYLPWAYNGELAPKMMKKTAGIQINIDYFDNSDLYYKLLVANKISPFIQAISSNSPFEDNKISNYKSQRAYVWHYTGSQRCNFFYKNLFKNPFSKFDPIKAYIKEILKVPMIYVEKENDEIIINGKINFLEFLKSKNGYFSYTPEFEDYILHQSLCFPDVRLKQYIEIRNHDSSNLAMVLALAALYKGLFCHDVKKLADILKYIKVDDLENYSLEASKYGLEFNVDKNLSAFEVINTLFLVARENLNSQERMFLKPIFEILTTKKTQADLIIEKNPKSASELLEILKVLNFEFSNIS